MPDVGSIMLLAGHLKTASDIAKTAMGLRDAQMLQTKILELQGEILSAQSSALSAQQDQFSMIEQIRSLEKKITDSEKWDAEAQKYELKQIDTNAFAYMHKTGADTAEPLHWLCVNCFQHGHKSVLQYQERAHDNAHSIHQCPNCKAKVTLYYKRKPSEPYTG